VVATNLPPYVERIAARSVKNMLAAIRTSVYVDEDGRKRKLFRLGEPHLPQVILLPPYGITFLLLMPLAELLSRHFNVVIWESPGCPDSDCPPLERDFTLASQASEFAAILQQLRIKEFHFIGWCQAAQLAAYAIVEQGLRLSTLSWIAPGGFGHALIRSEFERCALPIYMEIERQGVEQARKLALLLDKYCGAAIGEDVSGERLTMLHLADSAATQIFSKYMRCFETNKPTVKALLPRALASGIPTQIVHCRDDTYSHYSESVEIARAHPHVALKLMEKGGHLQIFNNPATIAELLVRFIANHSATLANAPC